MKSKRLLELANEIALATRGFFEKKGPGHGNLATNLFINQLGARATEEFGHDYSERRLCGDNSLAVDFYFPTEATIVEVALGLKNPSTEFEKDILKALMARSLGNDVSRLFFISKPGAITKCNQPGRIATREWLERTFGVTIEIHELRSGKAP